MKSHVADYRTRVYCARIEPVGSQPIVRLTSYPTALKMSNDAVYHSTSGYEFSGLSATADMSGSGVDLDGILQAGGISLDDLQVGAYDNARVYIFATSWAAPVEDEEPLSLLFFGKVDITDHKYRVQLMSAIDVLSQKVGRNYSPSCPWTLFDQHLGGNLIATSRSRCTGPRANPDGPQMADYLVTGTLTAVTDQYQFSDSTRLEADDWFGYGEIQFTTGANAGLKPFQIKVFASGAFTLHEALPYPPQVGDAYQAIPGCRKRLQDCRDKFGNAINFGGQPHVPSKTVYSQRGRGA
ncbi:DUF2163 domain-containing protein [Halopseudomonas sp.]|uniref:DUF2163 domain-containing protein n=1 Tax=Halopseudomonas sp. TaxID=2901191 RepID=UPI00311FF180